MSSDTQPVAASVPAHLRQRLGPLHIAGLIALVVVAAVVPLVAGQYEVDVATTILLYAYIGICWNLAAGYGGMFSLGHAAYFGIGAYASSLLYAELGLTPWLGMLVGAALSFIAAGVLGYLTFRYRVRGAYFALATLAVVEILRLLAVNLDFTRGSRGVLIDLVPGGSVGAFQFTTRAIYYYLIAVMTALALLGTLAITRSRLGAYLVAIREDEESASTLGVNVLRNKTIAFALSGGATALAGTFYAQRFLFIDPDVTFSPLFSIELIIPPIVGGLGTVMGPVLGSVLLTPLAEVFRGTLSSYVGAHLIVYGITLVVVISLMPRGILGAVSDLVSRRRARSARRGEVPDGS